LIDVKLLLLLPPFFGLPFFAALLVVLALLDPLVLVAELLVFVAELFVAELVVVLNGLLSFVTSLMTSSVCVPKSPRLLLLLGKLSGPSWLLSSLSFSKRDAPACTSCCSSSLPSEK
jgi:hypothetical protein